MLSKAGYKDLILTTLLKASDRFRIKGELRQNKIEMPNYDHIYLKHVAMFLYKYILIYYMMLNYPVPIINKPRVKKFIWSKDGRNAHLLTTMQ